MINDLGGYKTVLLRFDGDLIFSAQRLFWRRNNRIRAAVDVSVYVDKYRKILPCRKIRAAGCPPLCVRDKDIAFAVLTVFNNLSNAELLSFGMERLGQLVYLPFFSLTFARCGRYFVLPVFQKVGKLAGI